MYQSHMSCLATKKICDETKNRSRIMKISLHALGLSNMLAEGLENT